MTRTAPDSDLAAVPTVPTMSRRHAAGAESARGLLFTVLGEFVLPSGGAAWTSAFIEVLGRLGVEEKATRQALMRTAADGWLVSERVGRRTRWQLTPSAVQLLTEGTERIYGFLHDDMTRRMASALGVPPGSRVRTHVGALKRGADVVGGEGIEPPTSSV